MSATYIHEYLRQTSTKPSVSLVDSSSIFKASCGCRHLSSGVNMQETRNVYIAQPNARLVYRSEDTGAVTGARQVGIKCSKRGAAGAGVQHREQAAAHRGLFGARGRAGAAGWAGSEQEAAAAGLQHRDQAAAGGAVPAARGARGAVARRGVAAALAVAEACVVARTGASDRHGVPRGLKRSRGGKVGGVTVTVRTVGEADD